jgi:hypothetical protein
MISIILGVPGRIMTEQRLKDMALIAEREPTRAVAAKKIISVKDRGFPNYQMALDGAPRNSDGTGPDRSKADYWWTYVSAQRGFSVHEIEFGLYRVSEKAVEMRDRLNKPRYAFEKARDAHADWQIDSAKRSRV